MTVDLELLAKSFAQMVGVLSEITDGQAELDADYYWAVDPRQALQPYETPGEIGMGQISDCMQELRAALDDPGRVTTYHLVWLGDVLRALGVGIDVEIAGGVQ
jgi:hypothetical protein